MFNFCIPLEDGGVRAVAIPDVFEASVERARRGPELNLSPAGDEILRDGFCRLWNQKTQCTLDPDSVMVTAGGSSVGLQVALGWGSLAGECKVAAFAPLWFGLPSMASSQNIRLTVGHTTVAQGLLPSSAMIRALGDEPEVGALILNQFGTPAGGRFDELQLAEIAQVVRENDHLVVVEDAVMWMNSPTTDRFPTLLKVAPDLWERGQLIGVASLTKAWGLGEVGGDAGLSVGFMWGPRRFARWALSMTRNRSTDWSAEAAVQVGVRHAFENVGLRHMASTVAAIERNTQLLEQLCKLTPFDLLVRPRGGTNALVGVGGLFGKRIGGRVLESVSDVVETLQHEAGVLTLSGNLFHSPVPAIRINLGGADCQTFAAACQQMAWYVERLR